MGHCAVKGEGIRTLNFMKVYNSRVFCLLGDRELRYFKIHVLIQRYRDNPRTVQ